MICFEVVSRPRNTGMRTSFIFYYFFYSQIFGVELAAQDDSSLLFDCLNWVT